MNMESAKIVSLNDLRESYERNMQELTKVVLRSGSGREFIAAVDGFKEVMMRNMAASVEERVCAAYKERISFCYELIDAIGAALKEAKEKANSEAPQGFRSPEPKG